MIGPGENHLIVARLTERALERLIELRSVGTDRIGRGCLRSLVGQIIVGSIFDDRSTEVSTELIAIERIAGVWYQAAAAPDSGIAVY
jgi:hypothetical protein